VDQEHSVAEQEHDASYLPADSVWVHMARLLTVNGHRILEPGMHAQLEDGRCLVTWTEAHFMSQQEYHHLVAEARSLAGIGDG